MADICWVDLGPLGLFLDGACLSSDSWQDHGMGMLRTIMHRDGVMTDVVATRNHAAMSTVIDAIAGYKKIIMNVRSYSYCQAKEIAELYKQRNPEGIVIVGGMNTLVNLKEMEAVAAFDHIGVGPGENIISDFVANCHTYPRVTQGIKSKGMADWPRIDRTLWPRPLRADLPYPLENNVPTWGPSPLASVFTSRVCPWRCSFCNESSFIENMPRKPVDAVIDELNDMDEKYGPLGFISMHDSMFFQNPSWLEEWIEKYPKRARKLWPYWAGARSDTIRKWPDLFRRLVLETNWSVVSIGLESGSDRSLRTLNKECTVQDNLFAILMINQLGDEMEAAGRPPVRMYTNVILGLPGETREDLFETLKMVSIIKRRGPGLVSPSLYAPYPGGALGYQLIAENKSLINEQRRDRTPDCKKLAGVDYDFITQCFAGVHDAEALRDVPQWVRSKSENGFFNAKEKFNPTSSYFVFEMKNGKSKLAWGPDVEAAKEMLKLRLTDEEMAEVNANAYRAIKQKQLPSVVAELG